MTTYKNLIAKSYPNLKYNVIIFSLSIRELDQSSRAYFSLQRQKLSTLVQQFRLIRLPIRIIEKKTTKNSKKKKVLRSPRVMIKFLLPHLSETLVQTNIFSKITHFILKTTFNNIHLKYTSFLATSTSVPLLLHLGTIVLGLIEPLVYLIVHLTHKNHQGLFCIPRKRLQRFLHLQKMVRT